MIWAAWCRLDFWCIYLSMTFYPDVCCCCCHFMFCDWCKCVMNVPGTTKHFCAMRYWLGRKVCKHCIVLYKWQRMYLLTCFSSGWTYSQWPNFLSQLFTLELFTLNGGQLQPPSDILSPLPPKVHIQSHKCLVSSLPPKLGFIIHSPKWFWCHCCHQKYVTYRSKQYW